MPWQAKPWQTEPWQVEPRQPNPAMGQQAMAEAAERAERLLQEAGIQLTLGGEPTVVPLEPEGAEWTVAADGPSKLGLARAMAAAIQARTWPGSTLIYCSGKRYAGEVNPRWALRLITGLDGQPIAPWPRNHDAQPLRAGEGDPWLQRLGLRLGVALQGLPLRDPRDPHRRVWAVPLTCDQGTWRSCSWPLEPELRELGGAPGPAGLRLPLESFPPGEPCQLLTLEIDDEGWELFLPPLEREPIEELLRAISAGACAPDGESPLAAPRFSGVLPVDAEAGWQMLGLTADPGVLEINLPVCPNWECYHHWLTLLDEAATSVGLRSWREGADGEQRGTGGGNHLLWGGPSLEANPFFTRPAWLVGILRYWQHHPCLAYLFTGDGVGTASQAPRADEALGSLADLELAYRVLEEAPAGDQRELIGETLRHLHADRSGNNHRSEVSFDKFWNPGVPGGCQGLIEFRAIESLPSSTWTSAIALLWTSLAALQLDPQHRPQRLHDWGAALHDRMLLPSALWADLSIVLVELASAGLPLDPDPFRAIWQWRFPQLLHWREEQSGAALELRHALEPWPLICDTPREGGHTSRFVDGSLRRFELTANASFRQAYQLRLQGRLLPLQAEDGIPMAVRWREQRLYPCLHPGIPPEGPLNLAIEARGGKGVGEPEAWSSRWVLEPGASRFVPLAPGAGDTNQPTDREHPWQYPTVRGSCTIDLRQAHLQA
ncbi:MAG: transglutaminase family protein [Cyanobacteriota bacterium]|nr:transglutaminase family protein [Cyanobacteriota bacterium]